jgi:3-hydroxyisobutyrate dehydrogenase
MPIVFLGLGKMGLPMALHLVHAGHAVIGVEPNAQRRASAEKEGIRTFPAFPHALASFAAADPDPVTVCSSLPDDDAMAEVGRALASAGKRVATWIETSTVSLEASVAATAFCHAAGIEYLRAPVSGNAVMATNAQLTLLVSGPQAAYTRCEPLFTCWGPKRFYLGNGEQARTMKLVLNLMVAVTSGMLAEALTLGQRGGLAWTDLWDAIVDSAVGAPLIKAKAPALRARDYTPTFTVQQMRKDLGLIVGAGQQLGVDLPLAKLVQQAMVSAVEQGDSALDYAAVIRVAQRAAGLKTDAAT